jgi:hypothetical protein
VFDFNFVGDLAKSLSLLNVAMCKNSVMNTPTLLPCNAAWYPHNVFVEINISFTIITKSFLDKNSPKVFEAILIDT